MDCEEDPGDETVEGSLFLLVPLLFLRPAVSVPAAAVSWCCGSGWSASEPRQPAQKYESGTEASSMCRQRAWNQLRQPSHCSIRLPSSPVWHRQYVRSPLALNCTLRRFIFIAANCSRKILALLNLIRLAVVDSSLTLYLRWSSALRREQYVVSPYFRSQKDNTLMNIKINSWKTVCSWTWIVSEPSCGICRSVFEQCCPSCAVPGDDCPLSTCP